LTWRNQVVGQQDTDDEASGGGMTVLIAAYCNGWMGIPTLVMSSLLKVSIPLPTSSLSLY
jgi:hypothetical protein